jgi:hypothetical protein
MPKLVEMTRFKSELPLKELKTLRDHFKKQGSAMPAFNYFFSIDKNGDVVSGKFDGSNNNQLIFFDSYINNIFNKYKWYPAFYSNTKEKLRTAVNMSIYDHKGDIFKVSIRLMYLLDKEKIEDIVFEKNLIYEIEIN